MIARARQAPAMMECPVTSTPPRSPAYRDAYAGWLSGLLTWQDYEQLMAAVAAAPDGWFVYDTRGAPPNAAATATDLPARLHAITAFLRDRQRADYCGFVYVDDRAAPAMIKVYDPRTASACGASAASIPTFTLSRMPPEALPFATDHVVRSGLLGRLIKGST